MPRNQPGCFRGWRFSGRKRELFRTAQSRKQPGKIGSVCSSQNFLWVVSSTAHLHGTLARMILTGVALVVLLVLLSGVRIAREYQRAVVFRLGRYTGLRGPGLFWLIPLGIENETRIDLRVVTSPIEQQETITRDSVTVKVNAVLWYRVSDPQKAVLNVENFRVAVQQVALTSLRNVIGQHDLDEVLKSRDQINSILSRNVVENITPWGVAVDLLEMKDVEIPQDMQRVMAMEAEAMREKRARIIKAEAELEASKKLAEAAQLMVGNPAALELRRMQMVAEVGAENNSTTVIMMPAEFVHMAGSLSKFLRGKEAPSEPGG
jgi:regulator of protease activity HflC (stomatin/prohibitin superfamily)